MKKTRAGQILERYETIVAEGSNTRIGRLLQQLNGDEVDRALADLSGREPAQTDAERLRKQHLQSANEARKKSRKEREEETALKAVKRFKKQHVKPANAARTRKKQERMNAIKQTVMVAWKKMPTIRSASPRNARSMLIVHCQTAGIVFAKNANRDISEATEELAAEGLLPSSFCKDQKQ